MTTAHLEAARNALRQGGLLLLMAKALRYLSDLIVTYGAQRALTPRRESIRTISDALDTAYGFADWDVVIAPMQVRSEIEALLELLAKEPPRAILEIGTARGGTLFLLCHVASPDCTLISVDLPGGDFGGGYPPAMTPLLTSFAQKEQVIDLIRADSHSHETLEEIERILDGRALDFLLIDGDHTYEGVRRDFMLYSPLVRRDGWIAFHDIVPGRPELCGGVPDFWNELKPSRTVRELVHDRNQGAYGIGLIKKETDHGTVA
jgi:predicted O-methyltransferase YrrM